MHSSYRVAVKTKSEEYITIIKEIALDCLKKEAPDCLKEEALDFLQQEALDCLKKEDPDYLKKETPDYLKKGAPSLLFTILVEIQNYQTENFEIENLQNKECSLQPPTPTFNKFRTGP